MSTKEYLISSVDNTITPVESVEDLLGISFISWAEKTNAEGYVSLEGCRSHIRFRIYQYKKPSTLRWTASNIQTYQVFKSGKANSVAAAKAAIRKYLVSRGFA